MRRESYVGEWLPEPLVGEPAPYAADAPANPEQAAEMADSLSLAFLVVLETLTPEQRAVLLLRDAFDYPYEEIAQIIGKSLDATRQLALRARRHVEDRRPRFEASRERRDELARRFIEAAQGGDLNSLEELLAHDVVLRGDGGGKAPALARSLHGRTRVAKTLRAWGKQLLRHPGAGMELVQVNGGPGALTRDEHGDIISVLAFDIADGQIQAINGIVNPDKLARIGPVADAWEFLGRRARLDQLSLLRGRRGVFVLPRRADQLVDLSKPLAHARRSSCR